jgi:hypothetical protein
MSGEHMKITESSDYLTCYIVHIYLKTYSILVVLTRAFLLYRSQWLHGLRHEPLRSLKLCGR